MIKDTEFLAVLQIKIYVIKSVRTIHPDSPTERGAKMVDISGGRETTATAPAWQVRESARQKILEEIKRKIINCEDEVGRRNVHRLLLHILDKELAFGQASINNREFENVPPSHKELVLGLFSEISKLIRQFQRSELEGNAILAKLFEWIAYSIVQRYYSALQEQEMHYPTLIYGVERATDEVPFE